MKILITGAEGQLGRDCRTILKESHTIIPCDLPKTDITDAQAINALFRTYRPDTVINCAAYTHVDNCETHKETARQVNAEAPGILAAACSETGARFIHISTDYVFDGTRTPPSAYTETDEPSPQNEYGRGKLKGEQNAFAYCSETAILRTAWLYGINGNNFPKTILRAALGNPERPLRVVDDQYGSPTWALSLAGQIKILLNDFAPGVYHATSEGHCTWYTFAKTFLDLLQVPCCIEPCATSEYPTPASRPANSILENAKLKARNISSMRYWKEDLKTFTEIYRGLLLSDK